MAADFIKIRNTKPGGTGFFVLARRDFDPAVHELWTEPVAEPEKTDDDSGAAGKAAKGKAAKGKAAE